MEGKWVLLHYAIRAESASWDEDGGVHYETCLPGDANRYTVEKVLGWIERDDIVEDMECHPIRSYPTIRKARVYAASLARRDKVWVETIW